MGFITWIFIIAAGMAMALVFILMGHFTRAVKIMLEAFATFIEVLGMHNQNSEQFRLKEPPAYSNEVFKAEADRLRKLMNASSIFK